MTPVQRRTFEGLLAVGQPRPTAPVGLVEELERKILEGTREAVAAWTKTSLYLTKSQLFTALKCEGQLVADAEAPRAPGLHPATAVGIVAHRAIQIAHTHPGRIVGEYVQHALVGARGDERFAEFWQSADVGVQSDLLQQATSKVTMFLDSWPALDAAWSPRFEEPVQAKVGRLTLSSRADLVLGRPRADMRQSMLLCDLKSGSLNEDRHYQEAQFYALVATLRHRVPPFRSTVYSLASGTYTDPEVTALSLHTMADAVVTGVCAIVDVLTARREAQLTADTHCSWCPVKATCPAFATWSTSVA